MRAYAVTNSIVDYLKSQNKDSSYNARKALASQYGISNYTGTASQNIQLLNTLKNQSNATAPSKAVTSGIEEITDNTPGYSAPNNSNSNNSASTAAKSYQSSFVPTKLTDHYENAMLDTDDDKPSAYKSKYTSTIDELLATIKNKDKFDVSTDANYNALYNQYKERYETQADKAMRNAMASANAATGGYGSSYGQIAGQQAYDDTMQGLNDNNLSLMQLAYQIYSDDVANDYNKLGAYQGQDDRMYSRYRDDVSDWQADRNYYANQYWNSYQNDRSAYESDRSFDYGVDKDTTDREYQQYQDALTMALTLAQNGQSVPSYLTEAIDKYNTAHGLSGNSAAQLATLAAQAAVASSGGSSGSGSGKRSSSSGSGRASASNSNSSGNAAGLVKLLDASKGALSMGNVGIDLGNSALAKLASGTLSGSIPTYHGTGTVADSGDTAYSEITNRNGNGWVYVDGLGRLTMTELKKYVDDGTVIETVRNGKYTYTYNKK